jgi:hypothetical protein
VALAIAARLDEPGELRVAPLVGELDLRALGGRERDALMEEPLVVLERELADPQVRLRAELRAHLSHVGLDRRVAHRERHGHAVVAVLDEVQAVDAVDVDRRHVLPAAPGGGDPEPPAAQLLGGGPERAVELAVAADRPDDGVQADRLDPQVGLRPAAERLDHLVERQHGERVLGLAAQALAQHGARVAAQPAIEVLARALGVVGLSLSCAFALLSCDFFSVTSLPAILPPPSSPYAPGLPAASGGTFSPSYAPSSQEVRYRRPVTLEGLLAVRGVGFADLVYARPGSPLSFWSIGLCAARRQFDDQHGAPVLTVSPSFAGRSPSLFYVCFFSSFPPVQSIPTPIFPRINPSQPLYLPALFDTTPSRRRVLTRRAFPL